MDSQLAPCEGAPSGICKSCSSMTPEWGYFQLSLMRRSADRKRGPHLTWEQRRDLDPQTLSRMRRCLVCSLLMTTIHHDKAWDYNDTFELSVLSSRRAMKKPGGYDWEECPLISLLPAAKFEYYSSPSGCTDLGFLAMTTARDEAHPQSTMALVDGQYQGVRTEDKRGLDFEYIRELVSICTEEHGETCASTTGPRVPNLRVIDCTTGSVVDAPEGCCYLALSYVWGEARTPATDDGTTKFSQVVQDSINITKSLGHQYLWVDKHCIDQSDKEHKHELISRMGDVYSQALFTIIVAAGESANDKIPHLRGVSPRVEVRLKKHIAFRVFTHAACALGKSKWASRAWTFQEGYLSPRRLIFTDEDVFFLCNHSFAAESSKVNIQHETLRQAQQSDLWKFIPAIPKNSDYGDNDKRVATLENHISEFSKRSLSFESDSLNALLGVLSDATKNRSYFPIRHLWGVPYFGHDTSLHVNVHWRHHAVTQRRPAFPSWSWCGWSGGVSFEHRGTSIRYDSSVCLFSVRIPPGESGEACERVALYENCSNPIPAFKGLPKDLLIKTRIVPIDFAPETPQTTTPSQTYAKFLVDENTFARVPVAMDELPLSSGTPYVGILLEHEFSEYHASAMIMLLAKAVGDHYERVGIVELQSERRSLIRTYVSNGQRPLHDNFSCDPWYCVQFCDAQYVDGDGNPAAGFVKPDKLPLQPWYRDAEIKEICLR